MVGKIKCILTDVFYSKNYCITSYKQTIENSKYTHRRRLCTCKCMQLKKLQILPCRLLYRLEQPVNLVTKNKGISWHCVVLAMPQVEDQRHSTSSPPLPLYSISTLTILHYTHLTAVGGTFKGLRLIHVILANTNFYYFFTSFFLF